MSSLTKIYGADSFHQKGNILLVQVYAQGGGQGQIGEGRYVAKYHMLCFAPLTCVTLCQADICLQKIKQGGAEVWFVCGRC